MLRPRQMPLTNDRIDRELDSPESQKIRQDLSALVREFDEQLPDNKENEEDLLPRNRMQPREEFESSSRGPLANRDKDRRVKETRVPPPRMSRQSFNPDIEPEEVEDLGPITNRDHSDNNLPGMPRQPPTIPEIDLLKKQLSDQSKKIELLEQDRGQSVETKTPKPPSKLAARRKKYDAAYTAVIPPSKGVFYDFPIEDLRIKRIDVEIQRAITLAKRNRDVSLLMDAVGSTLMEPIDIRDLTSEDWFFVLYYHLFNSYPKSSFTLKWLSQYGNENVYRIKESDITYINPGISREEYRETYLNKGICVPTLREWELLNSDNDLTPEDKDIVLRAQYYVGNTIEEKVDNYFKYGENLDYTFLVDELRIPATHGVRNTVDVIDAQFSAEKFVNSRRSYLDNLKVEAETYKNNADVFTAYQAEIDDINKEVADLELKLEKGEQVRPEVETRPVRFDALDIFPFL